MDAAAHYFVGKSQSEGKYKNPKLLRIGIALLIGPLLLIPFGAFIIDLAEEWHSSLFNAFAVILFILLAIAFIIGIVFIVIGADKPQKLFLVGKKYDEAVINYINKKDLNPKECLGLDDSEVMEIEPIKFGGYEFVGATYIRKGEDGIYRSNIYEEATLFFTRNEVHMYKVRVDTRFDTLSETTEVLFYEDVVSVSTVTRTQQAGNDSINYLSFVLSSRGGKEFYVSLDENVNGNCQRSINAMRALIKEKKMK